MIDLKFEDLGLPPEMVQSLAEFGYESPSPIQAEAIPFLLDGRDIIGQAQTGTGKTAAFALPLLARLNIEKCAPQVLVLAPTRELAIQVAESFQKYARSIKGFHVLPIYGGQGYHHQLKPLKRGVHVVVGTPGRVCDHIRRGSLKLNDLQCLVLDEADEMLKMGFIEEVNWVLEQAPEKRQIALFSATMPAEIKRIATKYLNQPAEAKIKAKQATADTINQRFQVISGRRKIDALSRIIELEETDAVLVFVRTKISSAIVAEQLEARGLNAAALNGDIVQAQREKIVQRLKNGGIDIIVATDVAARGLDVSRISHVVNFDAPTDPESYVHRIGRTGRAGSTGEAILFVTPREKRLLNLLERVTKATINPMVMPTTDQVNALRIDKFKEKITQTIEEGGLNFHTRLIDSYLTEHPELEPTEVAAALAHLAQGGKSLLVSKKEEFAAEEFVQGRKRKDREERHGERGDRSRNRRDGERGDRSRNRRDGERGDRSRDRHDEKRPMKPGRERKKDEKVTQTKEKGMIRYRLEVGYQEHARPASIVATITKAAGLNGKHIGHIEIFPSFSTVDLPEGMPREVFDDLKQAKVGQYPLKISEV